MLCLLRAAQRKVGSAAPEECEVVLRVAGNGHVEVGEGVLRVSAGELHAGVLDQLRYGNVGGDVGRREGAGKRCRGQQPEG
ncbi:hypothetical protein HBH98_223940 [Parastagonospora nodorum]|nr:hypothetical protein HBH52_233020 [Parastagonospora nodorum]KAH4058874.1 hypothetical protein HBH50_232330 [Parastagonospora nodorum]KAH4078970.1 hypothetical protein HBH48_225800 [Parastagonospora nodorum]KAH4215944.1 hypothetical protein HBI06_238390 [Parastagonospora nodorum]KAH4226627.1 hypothetical protein HBI05_218320 [Parastagonospora nodorum]